MPKLGQLKYQKTRLREASKLQIMANATLSNMELAGKVALVVGGSSGIGYSVGLLMAQRGARVAILADRGAQEALTLAAASSS